MTSDTHAALRAGHLVDEQAVVALTQELVRIPSTWDPARERSEQPAAERVAEVMRGFGWQPEVVEVAPGRPNVVAVVDGGLPGPTLMFEGHTDVVTEGSRDEWTVDPFGGEIVDGRLYGRGSADMKAGVAAMIHATRAVELAGPFPGRIVVAALVDEEGQMLGAKHFTTTPLAAEVDAAIVCEPEAEEICAVAKGAVRLLVTCTGRMAHGAMPQHGRNPIPAVAELVQALSRFQAELQVVPGEHEHLGLTYLTPTVLDAGSADQINVIPGRAVLGVDCRTVPGVDHAALAERVRSDAAAIGARHGVTFAVDVVDDRPCAVTPEDHPIALAVARAHRDVTGVEPAFGGVPGATDGTILWRDSGIPNVVYGPGPKWIAHQPDEYVEVDDVVRKTRVYAEAALVFLTGATVAEAGGAL
ncbi:succinyl-diaminopimelate desuccinylase [Micromonospora profundi]|uniref:M20 family metallopeptidase n=1 Tax=Micromonospora profundi TaxID=1420889 RepID=UPI001438F7D7|nr:M20 family metallopeptidase [Micromonospora profundi]NJC10379.1 succinyl-diaminopimelate desuccinylase [Micromonospora profundi]